MINYQLSYIQLFKKRKKKLGYKTIRPKSAYLFHKKNIKIYNRNDLIL